MRPRLAASLSLLLAAAAVILGVVVAVGDLPSGLLVVALILVAAALAWVALIRRGLARTVAAGSALVLVAGAVVLIATRGRVGEHLAVLGLAVLAVLVSRSAFLVSGSLPSAPRPKRPVLFWNPRSGDGKAARARLPEAARARGIEPVELAPGDDLRDLVADALRRGADALAMAGGDGSQAIVAALAAEHDLPYACIPAGTRNHFALDLGVDRDDLIGALDAFVDGGERRVDLADVDGRVFVNNVSLGVYADAVQQPGYRAAKIRTIVGTLPEAFAPEAAGRLHWAAAEGRPEGSAAAILVSNDPYRLGRALGSGTRPRLDLGRLGVAIFDASGAHGRPVEWSSWSVERFEIRSDHPVAAGIDGEAAMLDAPLRFHSRPGALRVRIARAHPGSSPSAALPDTAGAAVRELWRLALGKQPSCLPAPGGGGRALATPPQDGQGPQDHDQGVRHGADRAQGEDDAATRGGRGTPA